MRSARPVDIVFDVASSSGKAASRGAPAASGGPAGGVRGSPAPKLRRVSSRECALKFFNCIEAKSALGPASVLAARRARACHTGWATWRPLTHGLRLVCSLRDVHATTFRSKAHPFLQRNMPAPLALFRPQVKRPAAEGSFTPSRPSKSCAECSASHPGRSGRPPSCRPAGAVMNAPCIMLILRSEA